MGMHARAIVSRQRHLPGSCAPGRLVRVRHAWDASTRSARAVAERPRERRTPQTWRRAGRRAASFDPPRRRLLRPGALVDAQGGLGRPLGVDVASGPLMSQLPIAARVYVATVVVLGIAMFGVYAPQVQFQQPFLLIGLLLLSSMSAALKVYLPLTTGGSTMSVSYAVDFASLLLLGPHETMLVAAGSAFSQCHFNSKDRNPLHRTLFSVASLVITVQGTGLAFSLLGGGTGAVMPLAILARPLVGAATVYFLLNTGLIATAIALSTRAKILTTWNSNFLWSAPSYFVGAGSAALAALFLSHAGYWVAP